MKSAYIMRRMLCHEALSDMNSEEKVKKRWKNSHQNYTQRQLNGNAIFSLNNIIIFFSHNFHVVDKRLFHLRLLM